MEDKPVEPSDQNRLYLIKNNIAIIKEQPNNRYSRVGREEGGWEGRTRF